MFDMIIKGKRLSMHVFVCLSVYVSKGKRGDGKEREGGWVGRGRWREREGERERDLNSNKLCSLLLLSC